MKPPRVTGVGNSERLAIDGGVPVRSSLLPYGRHAIDENDVAAVAVALRSGWLTGGPVITQLETSFAATCGTAHAVAVSSGSAALHVAVAALGVGPGDEVVVPAFTFVATANAVVHVGATPVFADVDPDTLLVSPASVEAVITPRTRAIVAVDFAGQPADYDALRALADRHRLALVADACHSLGGRYHQRPVGSLADVSAFSLHPVKHVAAGEGGVVTTDRADLAAAIRALRSHGIATDHRTREAAGTWHYDMTALGFNYRLSELHSALALSQLGKLESSIRRRAQIAARYDAAFADLAAVVPLATRPESIHAHHLYVVRLGTPESPLDRKRAYAALRAEGSGAAVHYMPGHLHIYYRRRFGCGPGDCPAAEAAYERVISLPLFPSMEDGDVDDVIEALHKVARELAA